MVLINIRNNNRNNNIESKMPLIIDTFEKVMFYMILKPF